MSANVLWRNCQWAITSDGIESIAPNPDYFIPRAQLNELIEGSQEIGRWPVHVIEKSWVNFGLFFDAYSRAFDLLTVDRSHINLEATGAAAKARIEKGFKPSIEFK